MTRTLHGGIYIYIAILAFTPFVYKMIDPTFLAKRIHGIEEGTYQLYGGRKKNSWHIPRCGNLTRHVSTKVIGGL